MIFIKNITNYKLICEYVNPECYKHMIQSEVSLTSVLATCSHSNAKEIFKNNIFPPSAFVPFMCGNVSDISKIDKNVKNAIKNALVQELTYCRKDNGISRIKTSNLARYIRNIFKLCLVKPENRLLIYNYERGYWQDDLLVLDRFIYEVISTTLKLKWSDALKEAIIKEVDKKLPIIKATELNNKGFAFKNYSLNYLNNQIVPHNPDLLSTMHSDIEYDPNATCPIFINNMNVWFKDDLSTQSFVQEWFGYVLSGSFKANAFLLVYSKGGEGKSTLFGVLEKLVGPINTTSTSLSNLNTTFGLEPLVGKKLNLASENNAQSFDTSKLKAITAGEKITVNRKNIAETEMILPIKMVYLLNELPVINDGTRGLMRRLLILPFLNTIPVDKQDKELVKKLDNELSGILNWSLQGLHRLQKNNYQFTISTSMQNIKNQYLTKDELMKLFIKSQIQSSDNHKIEASSVIEAFDSWIDSSGYPKSNTSSPKIFWKTFEVAARALGVTYTKYKSNGRQVVSGIKLT